MSSICAAHKLVPLAFLVGAPAARNGANQLLLTCVLPPGHLGSHLCGHESWVGDQQFEGRKSRTE